jgi:hypothetical protein
MLNVVQEWKQNSSMVFLWENDIRRIEKIKGFVKYDAERIGKVFNSFREEVLELQ